MSEPDTARAGRGAGRVRPHHSLVERLRGRWSRTTREALEADDEARSRLSRGTIPISEVQERHKVVVSGVLQSITYSPVDGPVRLLATLYDGTGTIELRWLGRRTIPGISVGRHLEVEGTASLHIDHLVLIDPLYRLLAPGAR